MTYDSTAVENDPHLIQLRSEVNVFEAHKDALYDALKSDLTNDALRIRYDIAVLRWSRATNAYQDALRALVLA
jgi:hypothetical protein